MNYRAGIVGCGRIGCGFDEDPSRGYVSSHAGAYAKTPGVELAALCDWDEGKLEKYAKKYGVCQVYGDYRRMLDEANLEILSVCTLSEAHLEIVAAAAESGIKAIFCEKPIADSLMAADEMIRNCRENNVLLIIDHQRRFDPLHRNIAAFLREGGLGEVQQATCYYTAGVANTGTHLFDLLRFFLGEAEWVEGRLSRSTTPEAADPSMDAWISFASGATAAIQACDVRAYTIFEIALLGTKGRLRLGAHGFRAEFEEARASERFAGYRELFPAALPVSDAEPHEFMINGVDHMMDCLRRGQEPISSGEDGRAALELVCAVSQSAYEGGKRIELPLAASAQKIHSR